MPSAIVFGLICGFWTLLLVTLDGGAAKEGIEAIFTLLASKLDKSRIR
jgi:hypothetical protein